MAQKINIIIPAYNEEGGIGKTLSKIPAAELNKLGYDTEVIVVDNGSTDNTVNIAKALGATVIHESTKGYGSAYKTGFASVNGDFIATCDADYTYPVEIIPNLLKKLIENDLDFITTNRFSHGYTTLKSMPIISRIGNLILSILFKALFGIKIKDSQSGMWLFKSDLLKKLHLRSNRMAFSQEIKIEAIYYAKCKWSEEEIDYYDRIGNKKLKPFSDGVNNILNLFKKRLVR